MSSSTICAIATATGGAIGIVRISGPQAITAADKLFMAASGRPLCEIAPRQAVFGHVVASGGDIVDEVVVTTYRAPHSYTGEDAVEIACHGSAYILQQVVTLLIDNGCCLAKAGEFTQRAFLNGKMDLSQAEGVADLIASTCAAQHRVAMKQLRGGVGQDIRQLRDRLLHIATMLELELDFSDHEDLQFANRDEVLSVVADTERHISGLCHSFRYGNALRRGIPVAIVGETNAGKSTLLNTLVGDDCAIVSDIHGTTRDTIEEMLTIDGKLFRLIDTAGIRKTSNEIEQIGIQRTFQKVDQADIIVCLLDATCAEKQLRGILPQIIPALAADAGKHLIVAVNKTDLVSAADSLTLRTVMTEALAADAAASAGTTPSDSASAVVSATIATAAIISLSALHSTGVTALRQALVATVASDDEAAAHATIITNSRHYEALSEALLALQRFAEALRLGVPTDLASEDLRAAITCLADIVGEVTSSDILENVFKNFCIGK